MSNSEFAYLFEKYFNKTATAAERDAFMHQLSTLDQDEEITRLMQEAYQRNSEELEFPDLVKKRIFNKIFNTEQEIPDHTNPAKVHKFYSSWMKYAAAIILIALGWSVYHFIKPEQAPFQASNTHDIQPGGNRAVLTLGNGKKVMLNDASTGILARQGNIEIRKAADGQIIYAVKGVSGEASVMNSIETQNGGQYQVNLPDGTKVWLNAATTLKYPTSFSAHERKVELKGEAYFEVAKNVRKPFSVKLNNGAEVKVLGTHFNINAYDGEASINATLLEGSIAMKSGLTTQKIVPGQQAQAFANHKINVIDEVNLDQVIAWKNGFFSVDVVSLSDIMKQVEKWYNVKVIYKENVEAEFVAKLPRNVPLSELLKLLEYTKQVHFKLEGEILYVMK